jgi:hypothetical protein
MVDNLNLGLTFTVVLLILFKNSTYLNTLYICQCIHTAYIYFQLSWDLDLLCGRDSHETGQCHRGGSEFAGEAGRGVPDVWHSSGVNLLFNFFSLRVVKLKFNTCDFGAAYVRSSTYRHICTSSPNGCIKQFLFLCLRAYVIPQWRLQGA